MKKDKPPLIEALVNNHRLGTVPFHMPGHKKGRGIERRFARLIHSIPLALDMTEIPGLDDLHNPTGPIDEAQARASCLFGAGKTFFLVNGSTVGLHAAILSVCGENQEILLPRDVHRSVIGACILSGARPRYIKSRIHRKYFIPCPPTPEEVTGALNQYSVKAVLAVYPSYFGLAGNLSGIAKAAHHRGIPLIVDEAHGAHFTFSSKLPLTALAAGADITVQSTHKTLGAFTQAAMLHINKDSMANQVEVARQLQILQTTSPSYLLMSSLDAAVSHMQSSGSKLIDRTVEIAQRTSSRINNIPGLSCLGADECGHNGIEGYDPTKLYISVKDLGLTGFRVAGELLNKYRIQVEMSDLYGILCMVSIGSTAEDAGKLVAALREIARGRLSKSIPEISGFFNPPDPRTVKSPREAWFSPKETVSLQQSAGRIAAEIIAPYPPGIPLVCPGEEITREIIDLIEYLRSLETPFHGPADPGLDSITVLDE